VVERDLAKVEATGSSPVFRSKFMQRSERLLENSGGQAEWVPRAPLRYRKVCSALTHLYTHIGGWNYDHGDIDAIMFLRMFERGLLEGVPHWIWDSKNRVWKNTNLGL
jgi:hypothetical protein